MRFLKTLSVATTIAFFAIGLTACQSGSSSGTDANANANVDEDEWISLFNGENLEGWHNPYDWGEAWVENGEIRLTASKKFFLVTDTTFSDFILELDVRVPDTSANSGIIFRANVEPNLVSGYQAEVDPSARAWSGGLYDEARRGWLHPAEGDEAAGRAFRENRGDAFKATQWNHYRIKAVGDSLKIWVNDELTTAYQDSLDAEGPIAIQHHGEEGKVYRFRNIRVRRLSGSQGGASY